MNRKINLHQDEFVRSTLTGLLEIFDGTHNVHFGELYLTNKRIYVVSNRIINVKELSFWFEEKKRHIEHSTLIVGEHRIAVRWVYKGSHLCFFNDFQKWNVNA